MKVVKFFSMNSDENLSGDDLWYLHIGASNHISQRSFFYVLDEGQEDLFDLKMAPSSNMK